MVAVHTDVGPDEEHGGAGGAKDVGGNGSDEEEDGVSSGSGEAVDVDHDAAADDVEGSQEDGEAEVGLHFFDPFGGGRGEEEIIGCGDGTEADRDCGIPLFPPMPVHEWDEGDAGQEENKGEGPGEVDGVSWLGLGEESEQRNSHSDLRSRDG